MGFFYDEICEQPKDLIDYIVAELEGMDYDSEEIDEYMAGDYGLDVNDWEDEYTHEYIPTMTCDIKYNWFNIGIVGISIFVLYSK